MLVDEIGIGADIVARQDRRSSYYSRVLDSLPHALTSNLSVVF